MRASNALKWVQGTNSRWGIPFHIPATVPTRCGHTTKLTSTEFKSTKESMQESTLPPEQLSILNRCFHPTGSYVEFKKEEIEQSISDRFESQVLTYPDRLAVKTRTEELTYTELNIAANRVARALLARLGDGEEPVALLLEQGAPMIIGNLGVLKAGKITVPLDPSHPSDRTSYILEDCHAGVILTNNQNLPLALESDGGGIQPLNIDDLGENLSIENPGLSIGPDTSAYIIYTSGSTGQPKGITQNHRNRLHQNMIYTNTLHICAEDRFTLLSSVSAHAMTNIFDALLNGAAIYSLNVRVEGVTRLADMLDQEEITICFSGSPLFRRFMDTLAGKRVFPKVRVLRLSSQTVLKSDVGLYKNHFSADCVFVSGLSATEVGKIRIYLADKDTEIGTSTVPVGYPVDDKDVRVVDDDGNDVGFNQVGEIEVRSPYLSVGYWGNPKLTQETFRPDPRGGDQRIYRTGDMGRMSPDGCLEHLGRKDFQVKIRGYRVEVGEVEAALLELASIKEAVVLAQDNSAGEKQLVAYLVSAKEPAPAISEVRSFLMGKLPDHMVPPHYVFLDALPQLPGGKLDRRALPAPDQGRPQLDTPFVAPRTSMEEVLADIWAEVLAIDRVGIHDDFLDLGGDSLMAAAMMVHIEETVGKDLPLSILIRASTVDQLANILRGENLWLHSLIAIQPKGSRPPFFCVHPSGGHVLGLRALARYLGNDQPFYGLEPPGRDGEQRPLERVEDLAAHYIEEIRGLQTQGPYYLGGYSMGGTVAFEMAQQLRNQGQEVGLLALFDPTTPRNDLFSRISPFVSRNLRVLIELGIREELRRIMSKVRAKRGWWAAASQPNSPVSRPNARAKSRYVPKSYPGPITLFWADESPVGSNDRRLAWRNFTTEGLDLHVVPGGHSSMLTEPHVKVLAEQLGACLDAAQKRWRVPQYDAALNEASID